MSVDVNLLESGAPDLLREYLASKLGTPDFRFDGGFIELKLPAARSDGGPVAGTVTARFPLFDRWEVVSSSAGTDWHAQPADWSTTLCGVEPSIWPSGIRRDDAEPVTCPRCVVRLVALELVAPPAPQYPPGYVPARPRIQRISAEAKVNNFEVSTTAIANVIAAIEDRGGQAKAQDAIPNTLDVIGGDGMLRTAYVKSRRSGDYQTQTTRGKPREADATEANFWVMVDFAARPDVAFYVIPEWWVQNDIHVHDQEYLARNNGQRPRTNASTHHAIRAARIAEWRDRWDLLGLSDLPIVGPDFE